MKKNKNQQLMEQREQSQVRLSSAESRQKKAKGQYVQANRDWLVAKSREDGVKALPGGVYYKVLAEGDATSGSAAVGWRCACCSRGARNNSRQRTCACSHGRRNKKRRPSGN